MRVSDFAFEVPKKLIAQKPLPERSASRLMQVDLASNTLSHLRFTDFPDLLTSKDLLVFNNTRVLPARLFARKVSGGRAEILIERILDDRTALAHIRANRAPREEMKLFVLSKVSGESSEIGLKVIQREKSLFMLSSEQGSFADILRDYGHLPLPPYIERAEEFDDKSRYQTVYAQRDGAIAAPTAGLHFDHSILEEIDKKKIPRAEVTLHVGAGTFQPVRTEFIDDHTMHNEYAEVDQACCNAVDECRSRGGRVVAVGTTVVRALETAAMSAKRDSGLHQFFGMSIENIPFVSDLVAPGCTVHLYFVG